MVSAAKKETYSSINFIAIKERASLGEVDRSSPYPAILFLSREDDDDGRDIGKHHFRSVLLHPALSNASLLRPMLKSIILDFRSTMCQPLLQRRCEFIP